MTIHSMHNPKSLRRANKATVAAFFDVSLSTVDGWIRRGCPFIQSGSLKSSWQFDILAVIEWRLSRDATPKCDPEDMTPIDRKAWYDGETKRVALMEKARTLVPAVELAQVIPTTYSAIAQSVRAIPDNLERRLSLPPEAIEQVAEAIDHALEDLADRMGKLVPRPS